MDAVETFAEADATVTTDRLQVANQGVEFIPPDTYSAPLDSGAGGDNVNEAGVTFTPKQTPTSFSVTTAGYGAGDEIRVKRLSDDTVVDSVAHGGVNSTVQLDASALEVGERYAVYDYGASAYQSFDGYDNLPVSNAGFEIDGGWLEGSETSDGGSYQVENFTMETAPFEGSATVSWSLPNDVAGWDIVPFQSDSDGATIEVYAVDASDGTELVGPLDDPGDISDISRQTNVALRVDLSRSSTSENPRVEALYRRYKV